MSALFDLVSGVANVESRVHADPGHLLVILRNGRVVDAVEPGKRYRGGYRLAPWGHLQAFQVSLSPVVVELTVSDVPLAPDARGIQYHLPSVSLKMRVRMKPTQQSLGALVDDLGVSFAATLDGEVHGQARAAVHAYFRALSHEQAWGSSHEGAVLRGLELFHGLLHIESAFDVAVTADPRFRSSQDVAADTDLALNRLKGEQVVTVAEGQLGAVRAQSEAFVLSTRVAALAEVANQHGLNLAHLLTPELQRVELEQRHEMVMKMLEDPTLLRRSPGLEDALMRHLDQVSIPTVVSPGGSRPVVEPGLLTVGIRLATPELKPLPERLANVWADAGGDVANLAALGSASYGGRAVVLAITRSGRGGEMPLPQAAGLLGCEFVVAVTTPYRHEVIELVNEYVAVRRPELAKDAPSWTAQQEGDRLVIGIPDGDRRAADVRKDLVAADGLLLPPLQDVLPYRGIDVVKRSG